MNKPSADRDKPGFKPVNGAAVWHGGQLEKRHDWLFILTDAHLTELDTCVAGVMRRYPNLEGSSQGFISLGREDFPLPTLGPALRQLRDDVLHGRGFVQIRKLPVAAMSPRRAALMYWGISTHLGDEMASQNKHGHVLGHVRNLGQSVNNASERGPYSGERIPWHVDSCDIVGLLCLRPAARGGESSIASSALIYNTMLERAPHLVHALSEPVYRDRRDEIPAGKPPWYALPVFNRHAGIVSMSVEPTYIGSVSRHFDREPNTAEQIEGVAMVQRIADEVRLDITFEPGDIQFLNNQAIVHTRQAFEDSAEIDRRRHLLRVWLKNFDARPLGDAYYDRHGDRNTVNRPGGIVGADTVLNCPLDDLRD